MIKDPWKFTFFLLFSIIQNLPILLTTSNMSDLINQTKMPQLKQNNISQWNVSVARA